MSRLNGLKGLALTPPELGRIAIGRVVERDGRRLPQKDDQFTLTTQVQTPQGWLRHPLDAELRQPDPNAKLRAIPVRLLFNDPELNLRASYAAFDRASGRPICVGNGHSCRRATRVGVKTLDCPAPEGCALAGDTGCKPYGRLNVRIGEEDELGSFVFRTTGFNSIRTLAARLSYFQAVSGNRLASLPLALRLRGKSTAQSHRSPVFYVDLTLRAGMTLAEALQWAREEEQQRQAAGVDQAALDEAARQGLARGAFEESAEEGAAVVEEFYPQGGQEAGGEVEAEPPSPAPASLSDKLARKLSGGTP